jgi:hypothetical protein
MGIHSPRARDLRPPKGVFRRPPFYVGPTVRRVLILLVGVFAAVASPVHSADAAVVSRRDAAGRQIRFDVRAPDVDVDWYAGLLRTAAHGPEVESVIVRIVPWDAVGRACGEDAEACYTETPDAGGLIVVPAGKGGYVAHALLHEYGHHLDWSVPVEGMPEPNGTPLWNAARDIPRRLRAGDVRTNYSRGWERSVGEIFAEDYAQLHLRTSFDIGWLAKPRASVLDALRADLPGAPTTPLDLKDVPFVAVHAGTLGRAGVLMPFELLGKGRRVTLSVRLTRSRNAGARVVVKCGRVTIVRRLSTARRATRIDRRDMGPVSCTVRIRGTGRPVRYAAVLRLAVVG